MTAKEQAASPFPDAGEIRRVFKPSPANLAAGIILGALAMLAAIALTFGLWHEIRTAKGPMPVWSENPKDLGQAQLLVYIATAIGLGMTAVGLLLWSFSRFFLRILVREGGVEVRDASSSQIIPWDDIKTVTETRECIPPALRWVVRNPDRWTQTSRYVLWDGTGELLSFDANTVRDYVALGTMIKEATGRRGVRWNIVERWGE